MTKRMDDQPTFSTANGVEGWQEMLQYHADNRPEPVTTPDIIEKDHQRIIDLINAADRALQLTEIGAGLGLDPGKLKPVLRFLASEGHITQLVHRYVSNDIYNEWDEGERFRRQFEN